MPSVAATQHVADESVDVVFDAFHNTDHVFEDALAWFPKLREDGILAGHDFSGFWAEVVYAATRLAMSNGRPLMLADDEVWFIQLGS